MLNNNMLKYYLMMSLNNIYMDILIHVKSMRPNRRTAHMCSSIIVNSFLHSAFWGCRSIWWSSSGISVLILSSKTALIRLFSSTYPTFVLMRWLVAPVIIGIHMPFMRHQDAFRSTKRFWIRKHMRSLRLEICNTATHQHMVRMIRRSLYSFSLYNNILHWRTEYHISAIGIQRIL